MINVEPAAGSKPSTPSAALGGSEPSLNRARKRRIRFRQTVDTVPGEVSPKLGLAATTIGVAAAMYFVPDSYQTKGHLFLPALLAIAGLLFAPIVAVIRDFRSVIRAENILAFATVYWLLLGPLQGLEEITLAQKADVVKAFAAIGIFGIGIWLGAMGKPWPLPAILRRADRERLNAGLVFKMTLSCFALGIFYYAFKAGFSWHSIVTGLEKMRWDAPWSRDSAEGGWGSFVEQMSYFGMLLPALAVLMGQKTGWLSIRTLAAWALTVFYTLFQIQGGNRRYLGAMYGAALLTWLLSSKQIGVRKLILLIMCCVALLGLMNLVYDYRTTGISSLQTLEQTGAGNTFDEVRVDDNFLRLAQSIHFVPDQYPYAWGSYIYFALIRPIPRVFWPGKPISPAFRIQDEVNIGASLSSGVVGELYVSGGFLVILFGGWLYARLGAWFAAFIKPPRSEAGTLMYGAWIMALFVGCRSMQDLVMMSYVVLALIVVLWLFKDQVAFVRPRNAAALRK